MKSQFTGLVAAMAVVMSAAFLSISIWAAVGNASTPGPFRVLIVLVTVVASIWLGPPTEAWRTGAVVGLGVSLAVIFGGEFVGANPSFGIGQLGAALGTLIAIPVLGKTWSGGSQGIVPALGIVLLTFVVVALVRTVIEGGALGHDESAYALKARAWLFDTPDTGWQLHRAPLITLLGLPVIAVTESEVALRLIGVIGAVFALGAAAMLGHRLGGRWAGLLAAAGVGASLSFLRRGSEYLTDVPAAGILLLITWTVLGIARDPDERSRSVIVLGPLVAAAFYMRYQSALAIVGIALGFLVAWPDVVRQMRRSLLRAGGIAFVLILPHLIWATIATGSPWGVVLETSDAAGRAFLGEGLVDYARMFPVDLAGPMGAVMMLSGAVWIVWSFWRGNRSRPDGNLGKFVAIVVAVAVVPVGLVAHGEPRFLFYPVWLLMSAGAMAITRVVLSLNSAWRPVLVALAVILWLPLFTETTRAVDRNAESRAASLSVLVEASNEIESDAGASCDVLTTYLPQVTWYSACFTEFMSPNGNHADLSDLPGEDEYVLLFEEGKRQPADAEERYSSLGPATHVLADAQGLGDATIIKIRRS